MEQIKYEDLMKQAEHKLRELRMKEQTIELYYVAYRKFKRFMTSQNEKYFTDKLADDFIKESKRQKELGFICKQSFWIRRRVIAILKAMRDGDSSVFNRHIKEIKSHKISREQSLIIAEIRNYLLKKGIVDSTINRCSDLMRKLFYYMDKDGISNVSDLTLQYLSSCLDRIGMHYKQSTMRTTCAHLRILTAALYEIKKTPICLTPAVPILGRKNNKIIPSLSLIEEKKLLASIDRNSPVGKRDYAIILLGLRTGLRGSDVFNLKLTDIDWHTNTIKIVQRKTCSQLTLPLLAETGNAIADYLLNARPTCNLPYVFIQIRPPFTQLHVGYAITSKYFKKIGIRQNKDEVSGFHVLRHTAATRMLEYDTPSTVIANVLGHKSNSSTKGYLSTDEKRMKLCALSFNGIEPKQENV